MLVGPSKWLKQKTQIKHARVRNPNWPEANQLAVFKRGRGLDLGTTVNKTSQRSGWDRWTRGNSRNPGLCFKSRVGAQPLIWKIIFHSHANKTHFHKKGCAPSLILKVRVFGSRKWPIACQRPNHSATWLSFAICVRVHVAQNYWCFIWSI